MSVATISRDELKKKLDRKEKVVLLEILPEETYRRSHLPGAKMLPLDNVRETAPKVVPDKNAEVITYCMNKL
ncbi:MAG TPA: rhodanese-like domain-containing protein [Tepidisphaeraceae bacterium]|nr:rhodanese-like domain-containing protein [Tepidisphaeraceae bacterium]